MEENFQFIIVVVLFTTLGVALLVVGARQLAKIFKLFRYGETILANVINYHPIINDFHSLTISISYVLGENQMFEKAIVSRLFRVNHPIGTQVKIKVNRDTPKNFVLQGQGILRAMMFFAMILTSFLLDFLAFLALQEFLKSQGAGML